MPTVASGGVQTARAVQTALVVSKPEPEQDEEQISLYYLLQHYNSKNKAIYDAQKKQKKEKPEKPEKPEQAQTKPEKAQSKPEKKSKAANGGKQKKQADAKFNVPGQNISPVKIEQSAGNTPAVPAAPSYAPPPVVSPYVPPTAPPYAPPVTIQPPITFPAPAAVPSPAIAIPTPAAVPSPAIITAPLIHKEPSPGFGAINIVTDMADDMDDSTVELNQGQGAEQWKPFIVRKSSNEKILLDKPIYSLGRERDFVDYVVTGNKYIGHVHCHFLIRAGEYFVVDDNSKNHTYVNNQLIQPSTEIKITHGALIRLADEDFEFRIY